MSDWNETVIKEFTSPLRFGNFADIIQLVHANSIYVVVLFIVNIISKLLSAPGFAIDRVTKALSTH